MIYLFETDLDKNKPILFSLQKIFGIGHTTAKKICLCLGFSINMKTAFINNSQYLNIIKKIENLNLSVANDLKKQIIINNTKLINIKSYRGLRKLQGLPVRGQRTHTNAKSSRRQKRF